MSEPELWVFETTASSDTLAQVRTVLGKVWAAHPEVPESVRAEMAIAAGEIAANIIEHAGDGRDIHMRLEVKVFPNEVEARFIDNGRRADVDLASVRMPGSEAERGRGLAVARAVLRHLSYQRTADGNQWTLVSERFSG